MASTKGFSQWKKYYKGKGNLDLPVKSKTKLKALSGNQIKEIQQGEIITLLEIKEDKEYYSYASSNSSTATAWLPVMYKGKKYLCNTDSMSKPKEGGSMDFKLQTKNLIENGTKKKYDLMGQTGVDCVVFKTSDDLRKNCLEYIKKNKLLDSAMNFKSSIIKYFSSKDPSKIQWIGAVSDQEIQQFKYLGEVAIGLVLLEGKTACITGNPPFKKAKEIIFPLDESFAGADSFVMDQSGEIYPISSKTGKGAAASFWSNIFPKIMQNEKYRKSTILKDIYDASKAIGINSPEQLKTAGKKIIYEYGVRNLLNVTKKELINTYSVYEEFAKHDDITKYSPSVRVVFNKLKEEMKTAKDESALKNLDESTTVFFCKTIARMMNEDKKTMDIILTILCQKNYYQANQDMNELKKGNIKFDIVTSGGGKVKMIGTKSAYTNIAAPQGTINYEITKL